MISSCATQTLSKWFLCLESYSSAVQTVCWARAQQKLFARRVVKVWNDIVDFSNLHLHVCVVRRVHNIDLTKCLFKLLNNFCTVLNYFSFYIALFFAILCRLGLCTTWPCYTRWLTGCVSIGSGWQRLCILLGLLLVTALLLLQGVSIALLCKPCISYDRDVCLSIRPSVCLSHADIVWKRRKLESQNLHRPIAEGLLVFGMKNSSRNSKGFTPSEAVKWEWGRKNSQFSANNSPYLRNGAR